MVSAWENPTRTLTSAIPLSITDLCSANVGFAYSRFGRIAERIFEIRPQQLSRPGELTITPKPKATTRVGPCLTPLRHASGRGPYGAQVSLVPSGPSST